MASAGRASGTMTCQRISSSLQPSMRAASRDRKSTRLNSSHSSTSYAVFCLKKKTIVVKSISANPYTIGVFRLSFATIVLATFIAIRGALRRVSRRDSAPLAVIGFLFFGHSLTLFLAIKASSSSIGAIGLSTYGVDLLILGTLFAGERPRLFIFISGVHAALHSFPTRRSSD